MQNDELLEEIRQINASLKQISNVLTHMVEEGLLVLPDAGASDN